MVRQNTHVTGFRGDVDLDDALRLVDGLDVLRQLALSFPQEPPFSPIPRNPAPNSTREHLNGSFDSYLSRKRQAELNLYPYPPLANDLLPAANPSPPGGC